MMKAALVDNTNTVVNIIQWDNSCTAPDGLIPVILDDHAYVNIGDTFLGGTSFHSNTPIQARQVPNAIDMWRAKYILSQNSLLNAANTAIANMNSPCLNVFWSNAAIIHRESPTLGIIGNALGLSSDQIDQMFIDAESLSL